MIQPVDLLATAFLTMSAWLLQPVRSIPLNRISVRHHASRESAVARWLALGLVVVSIWTVVRGLLGLVLALFVAWGVRRWLVSIPNAKQVAQDRRRAADLPVAVDLLAACLASGATPLRALQVVGPCLESSLRRDLGRVAAALGVGGAPDEAWALLAHSDLAGVAAVMRRTSATGAPAANRLGALAAELRARLRSRALSDARALGVRSAGPLGVCFLPAFILIGVVPLVASLVHQWL